MLRLKSFIEIEINIYLHVFIHIYECIFTYEYVFIYLHTCTYMNLSGSVSHILPPFQGALSLAAPAALSGDSFPSPP